MTRLSSITDYIIFGPRKLYYFGSTAKAIVSIAGTVTGTAISYRVKNTAVSVSILLSSDTAN